jgi:exopolyphosphatase/guanosine-5'-triphosphate,3'-diphosphate pyrophosphatase
MIGRLACASACVDASSGRGRAAGGGSASGKRGGTLRRSVEVLEQSVIITNLGEGLTASGVISPAATVRLLAALREFRMLLADARARLTHEGREDLEIPVKAVATSAMRDAANAAEVLRALDELGFAVEVISGSREAELSFKGTLSGFSGLEGTVLTIDVGGGSTELILGTGSAEIRASHSFDLGSRRITELFLPGDPPSAAELRSAREWAEAQIAGFIASLPSLPEELIAVAGTATSALTIRDGIREYDSALVHGKRLGADELDAAIALLSALRLEERRLVPGLHPGRAPVIIGGLIILSAVLRALGRNSLLVSDTDILQGILLESAKIC